MKRFLNSIEAARILGVNVSTVKRWTDAGKLDCIQTPGGHRKFLMKHLNAFLKNQPSHAGKVVIPLGDGRAVHRTNFLIQAGEFEELQTILQKASLASDRDEARLIITGAMLAQFPLYQVFDELVAPVLRALGDLWQNGEITIAEEHVASQLIKDCIIELLSLIIKPPKSIGTAFCFSFEDDEHDIALRMVQVVLESAGISVINSGQRTPLKGLQQALVTYQPDRLYLSMTFIQDTVAAGKRFEAIRQICRDENIQFYAGGQAVKQLNDVDMSGVHLLESFEDVYNTKERK